MTANLEAPHDRSGIPLAPHISVVATVYRDAGSVNPLVDELTKVFAPTGWTYEIILVDDYSPDDSWARICEAAARVPTVKGVRLRRNRGQHIAVTAGLSEARGSIVVLMDGDLEDPVEIIPSMIAELQEKSLDIVYAAEEGGRKRLSSRFFWYVVNHLSNAKVVPDQVMLRVVTREIVEALKGYGEIIRVTSGLMADVTSNYSVRPIQRRKSLRPQGSTYSRMRRVRLALDSIIMLTEAPLNFMLLVGFVICLLTGFGAIFYLATFFLKHPLPGYTSLILAICFFGGLNAIMLGFIGRYLGNVAAEVRRRPLYQVLSRTKRQERPEGDA